MIANIIDPELRDDISVTLKVVGPNRDQLEITIDQQRPPCADFTQVGKYSAQLPEEVTSDDYPKWGN